MVAELPCRIYTGGTTPGVILKAEQKEAIRHGIFQVKNDGKELQLPDIVGFFSTPALQST